MKFLNNASRLLRKSLKNLFASTRYRKILTKTVDHLAAVNKAILPHAANLTPSHLTTFHLADAQFTRLIRFGQKHKFITT